jgi:hypothetical protein
VSCELFVPRGSPSVVLAFKVEAPLKGARLELRPLLAGRDFHATHRENGAFGFEATRAGKALRFEPYPDVPAVLSLSNGEYRSAPDWFRGFFYQEEAARELDATEDLASPGVLSFDLTRGEALWVLAADLPSAPPLREEEPTALVNRLRQAERTRRSGFDTTPSATGALTSCAAARG